MDRLFTIKELRNYSGKALRPLGLVPTMGSLHAGHMSLIEHAKNECNSVVVSIFVNPAQFGPSEDFNSYPRSLEADIGLLEEGGIDAIFVPTNEEIYPSAFVTEVHVAGPSIPLEGKLRSGHFAGVTTIVSKLLLAAQPDVVYFGQKDAQQVAVVRRMVIDLAIPVTVRTIPTVRTVTGIAISSRHAYLSAQQISAASIIFEGLLAARDMFDMGVRDSDELLLACRSVIATEPMVTCTDYLALVNPVTMDPWDGLGPVIMVVSARIADIRLIDNVVLDGGDGCLEAR